MTHVVSPWALLIRMTMPSSLESCNQVVSSRGVALWRYPFAKVLELTLRRRRRRIAYDRRQSPRIAVEVSLGAIVAHDQACRAQ